MLYPTEHLLIFSGTVESAPMTKHFTSISFNLARQL